MKIISNKLYEEYTKTTIDYHTNYSKITKEQLYDTYKFHCQGQRLLNEVVDYIYNLIQEDNKRKLGGNNDEEIIIVNDEPFYRIPNGTCYEYAPIPKEFKHYFEQLQQENQKYKEVIDKATKNEEEIMYLANKVAITTQNIEVKALRDRLEEIFKILKGE